MASKILFRVRKFLNRVGYQSSAFIHFEVELHDDKDNSWVDSYFTISDCSRQISLEFGYPENEKEMKNNELKIKLLKENIIAFEKALKTAHLQVLARKAKDKKLEKAKAKTRKR